MANATNVETSTSRWGMSATRTTSYAGQPGVPTPYLPAPLRGTLDDSDPAFVDELAKTRHVILFSDAAVGSSTGAPAKDVDEKARNAASFARKLGYKQIDVLGFSMGGFVCQPSQFRSPNSSAR